MAVLLSYPRSGNTWLRYCIEFLSKRPTAIPGSKQQGGNPVSEVIKGMGVNLKATPICSKSHNIGDISERHKLIVIVRDYKEAIVRHYKNISNNHKELKKVFLRETEGSIRTGVDYTKILEFYDAHTGDKTLVYYEDLITKPKKSILQVIDFLEVDHKYMNEFFNKYNFHKNQGIKSYHGGSFTHGDSNRLREHQNALPQEMLVFMTDAMKNRHPEIFNKYLKRYE